MSATVSILRSHHQIHKSCLLTYIIVQLNLEREYPCLAIAEN